MNILLVFYFLISVVYTKFIKQTATKLLQHKFVSLQISSVSSSLNIRKIIIGVSLIGLLSRRVSASCTSSCSPTRNMSSNTSSAYVPGSNSIAYVTTPNEETSKKIARELISRKLAACVNIIPRVISVYEWEDEVNEDEEQLLMIKTTTEKVNELSEFIRQNHPYSVAEVISVKIENGNPPYLDWVTKSVNKI